MICESCGNASDTPLASQIERLKQRNRELEAENERLRKRVNELRQLVSWDHRGPIELELD